MLGQRLNVRSQVHGPLRDIPRRMRGKRLVPQLGSELGHLGSSENLVEEERLSRQVFDDPERVGGLDGAADVGRGVGVDVGGGRKSSGGDGGG